MNIPFTRVAVLKAISYLQKSEKTSDPELKINLFETGIDELNESIEEYEGMFQEEITYIHNIKLSYTRHILRYLSQLNDVDMYVWFEYTRVLALKVNTERGKLFTVTPDFQMRYNEFLKLWRNEFLEEVVGVKQ